MICQRLKGRTHVCEEAVQRLTAAMVSHSDGIEVIFEPDGRNDSSSGKRQRDIALKGENIP